ncbi:hypothetical protein HDV00_012404 [Rhizophlyctis rosea]|nr:hypothetical protein HDV00_012404 [Rhizophlyctis rosea]
MVVEDSDSEYVMQVDRPVLRNTKLRSVGIAKPMHDLRVNRYLTGYGQERGGLSIDLQNRNKTPLNITYLESLPWIIKPYIHTLKIESTNGNRKSDIVKETMFQPAIDRVRPTVLELAMQLPPESVTTISIDFDMAFIRYTEHRPDAERGWDLGSGMVSLVSADGVTTERMYTETILIRLPTPDFSMPYNVITLTCTLMALFFGSMFNLLMREFHVVEVKSEVKPSK